jgi:hypothetical protein
MSEAHGFEVYSDHSRHLSISRRFAEIAPAPILRLHRHQDGYIAFAAVRDGEDFRPLVSIRASELETWFHFFARGGCQRLSRTESACKV